MAGFLDSLGDFTTKLRGRFAEGNKPFLEPDIANELSSLHMTFGGLLEGLPYRERKMFSDNFSKNVVRFDDLQRLMAGAVTGKAGMPVNELMENKRRLFETAASEGILEQSAANQNTLYRFSPTGRQTIADLLRSNSSSLRISGNEVDAYMHYVSGLNMNLMPTGEVKISPASQLTAEAQRSVYKAYAPGGQVWDKGRRVKALAFDLETAGGPASAANVNEVAARMMRIGGLDEAGRFQSTEMSGVLRETFSVNRMTLGTFSDAGVAQSLNIKFRQGAGSMFTAATGEGAAFANQVKPILREMAGAQSILGQNIMGFDIDQLIGNVIRTSPYMQGTDTELRELVGTIKGKMEQPGYVIDTLKMLTEYESMQGEALGRSKLMPSGSTTTRSIQNVLLNTNLIDYMKTTTAGDQTLWDLAKVGGGHHTGAFDTTVTAAFYEAMVSGDLELNVRPTIGAGGVTMREIKEIVSSGAFTPMTKISNPADVLNQTWRTMYTRGLETQGKAFSLIPVDPESKLPKILPGQGDQGSLEAMRRIAINDDRYRLAMDTTYMEQTSIASRGLARNVVSSTDDIYDIIGRSGDAWALMTRLNDPYAGTLTQEGSIFKRGVGFSLDDFAEYQRSISGLPFAGIGLPERNLTMAAVYGSQLGVNKTSISTAYSGALDALRLAPDLGVSMFSVDQRLIGESASSIIRTGGTGASSTLGMTVDTARQLNKVAGGNLFDVNLKEGSMPLFEVNAGRYDDGAFVNLQMSMLDKYDITSEGRASLISELKHIEMDSDVRELIMRRLRGEIEGPFRVTVGSLAREAAEPMVEAIEMGAFSLQGGTPLRMPMLDYVKDTATSSGVLKMGPVLVGDTYTNKDLNVIRGQAERARELFRNLAGESETNAFKRARRAKAVRNRELGQAAGMADLVPEDYGELEYDVFKSNVRDKINSGYDTVARTIEDSGLIGDKAVSRSFLKKATVPAVALGLFGLFAAHKTDEEELYNAPFEQGPTDPNGYYSAGISSADPIHERVRPRINPLATANLVFDNYDNRIGHTRVPGRF